MSEPSFFERVGGREAVERLVAAFYVRVEGDAELRALFPEEMEPGRERQRLFLEEWLGGEQRYTAARGHPRLRRRHFPFVITEELAERWLAHMAEAFRDADIPEDVGGEVLSRLRPLALHMVNADDEVPRQPFDPREEEGPQPIRL